MFVIWGSRTKKKVLGTTQERYACANCRNASEYQVIRVMRWFTLFWIPIFPFSTKYYVMCPVCDRGVEMEKDKALALIPPVIEVQANAPAEKEK